VSATTSEAGVAPAMDGAPQVERLTLPAEAGPMVEPADVIVTVGQEDGKDVFTAHIDGIPAAGTDVTADLAVRRLAALLGSFVRGHAYTIGKQVEQIETLRESLALEGTDGLANPEAKPLTFGFAVAIDGLRAGRRLRRSSWPTGSYVAQQPGYPDGVPINANTAKATGLPVGTVCKFGPYLMAFDSIDGDFKPWSPSSSSVLATDWEEVP
jgi:hypothetical protein